MALIDSSGTPSSEGLTNDLGFRLINGQPGSYRIRIRRIGFFPYTSPFVTLPQTAVLELRVLSERVSLKTVVITARSKCSQSAEDVSALATVREEIEKALRTSQLSLADVSSLGFVTVYHRDYDAKGSLSKSIVDTIRISAQRPFGAIEPADLAKRGYVRGDVFKGWEYFGPDEAVLLSREFNETHCFRLLRDDRRPNEIGLAFEPEPNRKVPDIAGVLWVNEESSELRNLEFKFVTAYLPRSFAAQGFATFRRMNSGAFLVDTWQLRVPRIVQYGPGTAQLAAVGHSEHGGATIMQAGAENQGAHSRASHQDSLSSTSAMANLPDSAPSLENKSGNRAQENLSVAKAPSTAAEKKGVVTGAVFDGDAHSVPNAYVVDHKTRQFVLTDEGGVFRLGFISSDSVLSLGIRRIGFRPIDTVVALPFSTVPLRFVMSPLPPVLDTLLIVATAPGYDEKLDRHGFYRRMKSAVDGTFITYADIEKRNVMTVTQLLREVPGVSLDQGRNRRPGRSGDVLLGRGRRCVLGLVIDGQSASSSASESLDDLLAPHDVGGIEIYPSEAGVPSTLMSNAKGCGLVVVWTRVVRPR